MESNSWTMSAGTSKTSKKGQIELIFLQYSNFKMFRITHDIVEYDSTSRQPTHNSIIRKETLNELKAVLDFNNSIIEIDSVILSVQ